MKFLIKGAFRDTGLDVTLTIDAKDQKHAEDIMYKKGILILSIEPLLTHEADFQEAKVASKMQIDTDSKPAQVQLSSERRQKLRVEAVKTISGFGIAALVLGIIACLTCWIPFLGLLVIPLGILGVVFGAIGVLASAIGRRSYIGLPISGIVISIVAVIIALTTTGAISVVTKVASKIDKARVTTTKANLKILHSAVNQFKMDAGRFPTEEEGLMALIEQPSDVISYETGGYLETTEIPQDGWGNDFIYELYPESGKPFVIKSFGADGEEGGEDYDADLYSTEVEILPIETVYEVWQQDDKRLRAEPQSVKPPSETEEQQTNEQAETKKPAEPPPKPQFKELSLEEQAEAERLFEWALTNRKMGRLPGMTAAGYGKMVDACRQIIQKFPGSEFDYKARRMLADISPEHRQRYNITQDEIDLTRFFK